MRTLTLIFVVLGLATLVSAANEGLSVGNVKPPLQPKPAGEPYTPPPEGPRVQGDTVADPFVIAAVPFGASGSTCGFVNDYDEVCPYSGSTSPDVVYRYDATASFSLVIDLCGSTYDTKVYVYRDTVGNLIACNDDYCEYQSYLHNVPVAAGHTYYIVVDGYGGDCGSYYLDVWEWINSCAFWCPDDALLEGEPDCYDGYNDTYNGGCGVTPFPVFQLLEPSCDPIVICGTTGVYLFGSSTYRDTDWFQLDLPATAEICLTGFPTVPCYYLIIDGRGGCENLAIVASGSAFCEPLSEFCYSCGPGTWWAWVGPNAWDLSYACGSDYWLGISGYTGSVSPAAETTWGRVKGLFR